MAVTPGAPRTEPTTGSRARLPILLFLFLGSGCAALIYELVWFHYLRLVVGSTSISIAALLVSFMGGMGLGSVALPRLVPRSWHPLRVYSGLELSIGVIGLILLVALPRIETVYLAAVGYGLGGVLLRAVVGIACLLPPTMLMGATLPAVARWVGTTRRGVAQTGVLYAANTIGAVVGVLTAGFYLLRVYDTVVATLVAVGLNIAVALVALWMAVPGAPEVVEAEPVAARAVAVRPVVLGAIALSGFASLGAEVVWTRQLSLLFGATVYNFSLILAVFLAGLGAGSLAGEARRPRRPGPGLVSAGPAAGTAVWRLYGRIPDPVLAVGGGLPAVGLRVAVADVRL